MIHYHGTPITPETAAVAAIGGGHAFISFAAPLQIALAIEVCQSFAFDNGAFSAWKADRQITDWSDYYRFVDDYRRYPSFDFAVIPDVIDGDEMANDRLLAQWPWPPTSGIGAPVWHMHESIARLTTLCAEWPRVCLGSSGKFATIGTAWWWGRIAVAMDAICVDGGLPPCKLHGLRMLNPAIFGILPLASADSTNIARNIGLDSRWRKGAHQPVNKAARAAVIRSRIESTQSGAKWTGVPNGKQFGILFMSFGDDVDMNSYDVGDGRS